MNRSKPKIAPREPGVLATTALIAALTGGFGSVAIALESEAFAVGWSIELAGDEDLVEIDLTAEIYGQARTIAELAVLDAAGEPMSFYRAEIPPTSATEARQRLGVSPVFETARNGGRTELDIDSTDLRARVSVAQPANAADSEIVAYIVDARQVEAPTTAIEIDWVPLDRPFLLGVRIEHSLDLTTWRSVGQASVAALLVDETWVTRRRIPIAASARGFLRITWDEQLPQWEVLRVELVNAASAAAPIPDRLTIEPTDQLPAEPDEGALYFDLGGQLPVQAAGLSFATRNAWVVARIDVSHSIDGPWRRAAPSQLFYRLTLGDEEFESEFITLGRVEAQFWRISSDALLSDVELKVTYPVESLRFAARGQAPYLLVAGTLADEAGPDPAFGQVVRQLERNPLPMGRATLAPMQTLGGSAALEVPKTLPLQSILLWLVLGLGVGVVVWMAVRLAREMNVD